VYSKSNYFSLNKSNKILLQRNFECIKHARKADYIGKAELSNAKESIKSKTEEDKVRPQTRAQSIKLFFFE
jgi:hypothetical protein